MKTIKAFTIDIEVAKELNEYAWKYKTSASSMVNDAVKHYLEYIKNKYESFEREEK